MSSMNHSIRTNEWVISYSQNDVDTIRAQIEQNESMKRRWLVLGLAVALISFTLTLLLLFSDYAQYSSISTDNQRLSDQNAALKARADKTQQQLDARNAKEAADAQARSENHARLQAVLPAVLSGKASGGEIASFAKMVYESPTSRVEVTERPSNEIFRNWKATSGDNTEVYSLVGGFVDGKWVIYSNLLSQR
jgi:cell division protein FtsB